MTSKTLRSKRTLTMKTTCSWKTTKTRTTASVSTLRTTKTADFLEKFVPGGNSARCCEKVSFCHLHRSERSLRFRLASDGQVLPNSPEKTGDQLIDLLDMGP